MAETTGGAVIARMLRAEGVGAGERELAPFDIALEVVSDRHLAVG